MILHLFTFTFTFTFISHENEKTTEMLQVIKSDIRIMAGYYFLFTLEKEYTWSFLLMQFIKAKMISASSFFLFQMHLR